MPSPDATYYNIKRLHLVFAVSSLALLAVTVWMVAADHLREWKVYQRTYRDRVEPWLTEAQIRQEETGDFTARQEDLAAALDEASRAVPERGLIDRFCQQLRGDASRRKAGAPNVEKIEAAYDALAEEPGGEARRRLLARLSKPMTAARARREDLDRRLRFRRADFNEARSNYEAGVGRGLPPTKLESLQQGVDRIKKDVDDLAAALEDASAHDDALTRILSEITREEDAALQALIEHGAAVARLVWALAEQRPGLGKWLLRLPVIDAFGRPLAIDQIWLPDLTIDYNFRQVARFDRCTTCHQGIAKTVPGSPSAPACLGEQTLTVRLAIPEPAAEPADDQDEGEQDRANPVLERYGLALAPYGILDPDAPTIGLVFPRTAAADADLLAGDVILTVDGTPVTGRAEAIRLLLEAAEKPEGLEPGDTEQEDDGASEGQGGAPALKLDIRRGLPHPYSGHPRLDLFLGSLSPHPVSEFGCTICHDGQGSATAFKFASHTPNDPGERARWRQQYGWFRNAHWDFPMLPGRFAESRCLKCHHEVTDLAPSRRFPDPPAPKLLAGYDLVRRNGCFGCHEIRGMIDSGERVGPDMRLEPNDAGTAGAMPADPGTMRKVGPALRDVAGKLDAVFLENWLRNPAGFRPSTRMPQFFGLDEHLDGRSLEETQRFENAEIGAVAEYLLAISLPGPPLEPPPEVTETPSAERGKRLFHIHGCTACHRHDEFPESQSLQAADLSNLGSKLTTEAGKRWLVDWIRDPVHYSPRTLMPNTLLEPILLGDTEAEAGEATKPRMTDPAADIAVYLLSFTGLKPKRPPRPVEADLDELALLHLGKTFPRKLAQEYLAEGIPESMADRVEGDARELLGPITRAKRIRYVGRRTIRKRGCYGCHDVPGFDEAQPIGPALSDWGRKQESLLAFEQIGRFLARSGDDPDRGFYEEALLAGRREGFIWQKLRAPRSFDYKKAENKGFNEQLLMGRFTLDDAQREAIITFVLGLVAEPPAEKYVSRGDRPRQAIAAGRKVLDRYGCAECHTLEMERWKVEYDPDEIEEPYESEGYAFLQPRLDVAQLDKSMKPDRRRLMHAEVVGMPETDESGELVEDFDDDDNPLYFFNLWEPAAFQVQDEWMAWTVGGAQMGISDPRGMAARLGPRPTYTPHLVGKRPPLGGAFARLLYPVVLAEAEPASPKEAWGWVPPPLVREGAMVRPAWLYDYLLAPYAIRPASVLRMPKYSISPAEAASLVDYFAAQAGVDFPYHSDPRGRSAQRADARQLDPARLDAALRTVIDRNTYCTKCHLVGDYSPGGEIRTTLAPRLDRVGGRIRPDYLRRWLAKPSSLLPYTAMPVNFPPEGEPLVPGVYPGSSLEQLDAVMDLLLNYDWYMTRRTSVEALIKAEEFAE